MKMYFKHSTRCPISAGAKMEVDSFLKQNTAPLDFELIDVIANRDRSNEIAQHFDIKHESPQVIIADENGDLLWTASHRQITKNSIGDAIRQHR